MFAIPFPCNFSHITSGPAPFVGSIVANLTLASAPTAGHSAYDPISNQLYLHYASTVVVCDLSGTPSIVTTISMTATVSSIAYLPISRKVFVLQSSHKYQLIDCTNNTAASQVTMSGATWSISPNICSSYSVDQTNDDIYVGGTYQIGKVTPSTGVATSPGFDTPDPGYAANLDSLADLAFKNADGYLYIASAHANHMLFVVDPASWGVSGGLVHDFGSTPVNITGNCKLVINRSTGHIYAEATGGTNKLYVMTDSTTLATITPTAQTQQGDYDYELAQVFNTESGSPGFVSVYDSSDTLLTRTSIGSGVVANPVAIYCTPECDRYAIQKASSGEVLQIVAR